MIIGAARWNDRDLYSIQTNNPTEEQLRKHGAKGWLETCGPTAAKNCLAAAGWDTRIACPGLYSPQPEEVLADWFNDPINYKEIDAIRPELDPTTMPSNRVPQAYPLAVERVFGARAEFTWKASWDDVIDHLRKKRAVQICLEKPGHYLAVVAYDTEDNELIFNDSWPARLGGDGFNRRMGSVEYHANVQPFAVVYFAREEV